MVIDYIHVFKGRHAVGNCKNPRRDSSQTSQTSLEAPRLVRLSEPACGYGGIEHSGSALEFRISISPPRQSNSLYQTHWSAPPEASEHL